MTFQRLAARALRGVLFLALGLAACVPSQPPRCGTTSQADDGLKGRTSDTLA